MTKLWLLAHNTTVRHFERQKHSLSVSTIPRSSHTVRKTQSVRAVVFQATSVVSIVSIVSILVSIETSVVSIVSEPVEQILTHKRRCLFILFRASFFCQVVWLSQV